MKTAREIAALQVAEDAAHAALQEATENVVVDDMLRLEVDSGPAEVCLIFYSGSTFAMSLNETRAKAVRAVIDQLWPRD
jgi:hypothetical protein